MSDSLPGTALILFSHGSVLCGAGLALEEHADRLRQSGQFAQVEIGYMNYSIPTFADAVARCYGAGYRNILVLPFFLVPGYFVTNSLPQHLAGARESFPDIEFTVATAIGFDESLADALIDAALDPLPASAWRDDLAAASKSCRANPACPLYGTPDCPRAPEPGTPVRLAVE